MRTNGLKKVIVILILTSLSNLTSLLKISAVNIVISAIDSNYRAQRASLGFGQLGKYLKIFRPSIKQAYNSTVQKKLILSLTHSCNKSTAFEMSGQYSYYST